MKKIILLLSLGVMFANFQLVFGAAQADHGARILVNEHDSGVAGEVGCVVDMWEFARQADAAGLEVLAFIPQSDKDVNEIDDVVVPAGKRVVAIVERPRGAQHSQILKFVK